MSLRERLGGGSAASTDVYSPDEPAANAPTTGADRPYQDTKARMHQLLLERLDLEALQALSPTALREELRLLVERLLNEEKLVLNAGERQNLVRDIQYEMLGYGPLEPLLADASVSDILVNTHRKVYVERRGRLEATDVTFHDDAHLMKIIDKIVSRIGRRVDESSPMVDARLPDGSRVNAIIPPLAIDGPILSIRRFAAVPLQMANLLEYRSLSPEMAQFIGALVAGRVNILISGGTGSGKTTLLNILSRYIPAGERVVTIEDAAELQLQQPHVVRLETRPPNVEGRGEIAQRALVRNALRMRPDRIVVGECRSGEALDMLQAMNTGHDGSLTTVHANSSRDALSRIETMVAMSGVQFPIRALRAQIASAVNVVIQTERQEDGRRRLTSLQEINGMEGDTVTMTEIFTFVRQGVTKDGQVIGDLRPTGIVPAFFKRIKQRGIPLPIERFTYTPSEESAS